MISSKRPLGITILAILTFLAGLTLFSGGIVAIVSPDLLRLVLGVRGIFVQVLGVALLMLGVLYTVVTFGLWKGMRWAWTLALFSYAAGIVATHLQNILSPLTNLPGNIDAVIFAIVVIYYLTRPPVKTFFHR